MAQTGTGSIESTNFGNQTGDSQDKSAVLEGDRISGQYRGKEKGTVDSHGKIAHPLFKPERPPRHKGEGFLSKLSSNFAKYILFEESMPHDYYY